MITRLSKIARLPATIREELNRRLHDGEIGRTILPWVNNLPETKAVMAELFNGKPIRHQNLSEWRHTGYQDWLFHQQRLTWFDRLTEEEAEIQKHDDCEDTFEALSNYFVYEIAQGVRALQTIKNPFERMERMQTLSREFARLQNAYNWSRRVELDFAKHKSTRSGTGVSPVSLGPPASRRQASTNPQPPEIEARAALPGADGTLPSARTVSASRSSDSNNCRREEAQFSALPDSNSPTLKLINSQTPVEERQRPGALPDAPRISETSTARASIPDCASPLPLSETNSANPEPLGSSSPQNQPAASPQPSAPDPSALPNPDSLTTQLINSQTPPAFRPIPPVSTPTPPARNFKGVHAPMRGRRFVCIEG